MNTQTTRKLKVRDVRLGTRHRQDMGDLQALADSIARHGLLQPIVITSDNALVAGERRLRACRDILTWEEIDARVLDVASLVGAQHDENVVRKDFTPSERVAIAEAIRQEIGNRQGQRTDKPTPEATELLGNCPEVESGATTRDAVARKAGFASTDEYRRAKEVVEKGTPELVEAMDRGEVSVSAAAAVAKLPKEEQRRAAAGGKKAIRRKAREVRQSKAKAVKPCRLFANLPAEAQELLRGHPISADADEMYALRLEVKGEGDGIEIARRIAAGEESTVAKARRALAVERAQAGASDGRTLKKVVGMLPRLTEAERDQLRRILEEWEVPSEAPTQVRPLAAS